MDDERQKKLQAGKEKLAKYLKQKQPDSEAKQRHRSRPKKSEALGDSTLTTESQLSDTSSVDYNSNISNMSSSPKLSGRLPGQNNGEKLFPEFEESSLTELDLKEKLNEYANKFKEYQTALSQRNDLISQLTTSLQTAVAQRDSLQNEAGTQAEVLALEINTLKLQLQQASEILRSYNGKNGISAQELLDAKNRVIYLEQVCQQKDESMLALTNQLSEKTEELDSTRSAFEHSIESLKSQMVKLTEETKSQSDSHTVLLQENEKLKSQLNELQKSMVAAVEADARQKDDELESLRQQLQESKSKSSEEVKELMKELETIQQSHLGKTSDPQQQLDALRTELEEIHGHQISKMKEQMRERHELQISQLQTEVETITEERDKLSVRLELLLKNYPDPEVGVVPERAGTFSPVHLSDIKLVDVNEELAETVKQKETALAHSRKELEKLTATLHVCKKECEQVKNDCELKIKCLNEEKNIAFLKLSSLENSSKEAIENLNNKLRQLITENRGLKNKSTAVLSSQRSEVQHGQSNQDSVIIDLTQKLDHLLHEKASLEEKLLSHKRDTEKKLAVSQREIDFLKEEKDAILRSQENSRDDGRGNFMDWDIAINLGDVTKDILALRSENEKLKTELSMKVANSDVRVNNPQSVVSSGNEIDLVSSEESLAHWKTKYDMVFKEKLELEMKLSQFELNYEVSVCAALNAENKNLKNKLLRLSILEDDFEKVVKEKSELRNRLVNCEEELEDLRSVKIRCEALESEKCTLVEKYMNQINLLEKNKLDLELSFKEAQSKYESVAHGKQIFENEVMELKHRLAEYQINSNGSNEDESSLEVENLIKEMISLQDHMSVLKFRLQEEEITKNALNAKVCHLLERCATYETQHSSTQAELETLRSQLESWCRQHCVVSDQLSEALKMLAEAKVLYEKELAILKEELRSRVSESEASNIKMEKAVVLGNNDSCTVLSPTVTPSKTVVEDADAITKQRAMLSETFTVDEESLSDQSVESSETRVRCDFQTDTLDLRQKLDLVLDSNKRLLEEKDSLMKELCGQKDLLTSLQSRFDNSDSFTAEVQDTLGEKLGVLQKNQTELLHELKDHKEKQLKLMDVLQDQGLLQETLRREKHLLDTKLTEKEQLENRVLHQKVQLEQLRLEKCALEEQLLSKDRLEQELSHQRRVLEEELIELEQRLKDREDILLREKSRLQADLKQKDLAIRKWQSDLLEKEMEFRHLNSKMNVMHRDDITNIQVQLQEDGLSRIEQLRLEMDRHHAVAITRLKKDLQNKFAEREYRLQERHSSEMVKLHADTLSQVQTLRLQLNSVGPCKSELDSTDTLLRTRFEEELSLLRSKLSSDQESLFNEILNTAEKHKNAEFNQLKKQLEMEMLAKLEAQQRRFELIRQEETLKMNNEAEQLRKVQLLSLHQQLSKTHKDELNQITQSYETTVADLRRTHLTELKAAIGLKQLSSADVLSYVKNLVVSEFVSSIQNLTHQWEAEYLKRLSNLRTELEERFKEATKSDDGRVTEHRTENKTTSESIDKLTKVEKLLEKKEEIIKKATDVRRTLEEVTVTEMVILKEHLQEEMNTVVEIQKEVKKQADENRIPVIIELEKVKEDYQKLQKKYEEIIREHVEIREYIVPKQKLAEASQSDVAGDAGELKERSNEEKEETGSQTSGVLLEVSEVPALVEGPGSSNSASIVLDEELKKMREKLEKKHLEEMEQLRIYFEKRCEDMESKYMEEVMKAPSDEDEDSDKEYKLRPHGARPPILTHICDSYAVESSVMDLEERYKKEFDEKIQQYREQLEDVRKDLESQHASEILALKSECDSQIKSECESVRMELIEKYTRDIDDIMARHDEEVDNLRVKYNDEMAKEITNVRLECMTSISSEVEAESKKIRDELQESHQKQLEDLRGELRMQHEKEMEIQQVRFSAQKSEEINQAVVELRDSLQQHREKAQSDILSPTKEQLLETVSETASTAAIEKAKELEEVRLQVEREITSRYEAEIAKLQNQLSETKQKLELLESEKGTLSEQKATEVQELQTKLQQLTEHLSEAQQKPNDDIVSTVEEMVAKSALLECERENLIVVETLREQFQEEIKELGEKHHQEITSLEEQFKTNFEEGIEKERERIMEAKLQEQEELKLQHVKELSDQRARLQDELTTEHITEFEAVTHDIDNKHQSELEDLRQVLFKEHDEIVEQLKHTLNVKEKEYSMLVAELKENQEKDLEELKEAHEKQLQAEIRRVRQEMDNLNEEKLQAVALDTDVLKSELESIHRSEIIELQDRLTKRHQKEMEIELKKTIEEMESKHKIAVSKLEQQHTKDREQLKEELEGAFELHLETSRQEHIKSKEEELTALRSRFEEELAHAQALAEKRHSNGAGIDDHSPRDIDPERTHSLEEDEMVHPNKTLISELKDNLKAIKEERNSAVSDNEQLKHVISDMLKAYVTVETTINEQLSIITGDSPSEMSTPSKPRESGEDNILDFESSAIEQDTKESVSFLAEEGIDLDLSHRISDRMFNGSQLDQEGEELIYTTGTNLQLAVSRLLQLLSVTVHQCHESKLAQLELVNTAAESGKEAITLTAKCDELESQLKEEMQAKDQLALELHKVSDRLSSYLKEKASLEEQLRKQEDNQNGVLLQLEKQRSRSLELEEQMSAEKDHLEHQRKLISEGLGHHEQLISDTSEVIPHSVCTDDEGLLEENSRLYADHRNLKWQTDKDRQQLTTRIHELETSLEETVSRSEEIMEERRQEIEDLKQQVEALDKQLRANKQFIEEQVVEREQERDDYQKELNRLDGILKEKEKLQDAEGRLLHEIETLAEQLQHKSQNLQEMVLKKTELETELQSSLEKISDFQEIIHKLEVQLEDKSRKEQDLTQEVNNLKNVVDQTTQNHEELVSEIEALRSASATSELSIHVKFLEDQLESRSHELESFRSSQSLMQELRVQLQNIETKVEKKTRDLEALQLSISSVSSPSSEDLSLKDQLEAMRSMKATEEADTSTSLLYHDDFRRLEDKIDALTRAEEAAIKRVRDLEMVLRKQKQQEEDLLQDKDALQKQVNRQLLQISALQARIEERRHNVDNLEAVGTIVTLQEELDRQRELLEHKDKECDELQQQIEQSRQQLVAREDEIAKLLASTQRCTPQPPIGDALAKQKKEIDRLTEENFRLTDKLQKLEEELNPASLSAFAGSILQEKNEEIDQLTSELKELQSQLEELKITHIDKTPRPILTSTPVGVQASTEKNIKGDGLESELNKVQQMLQENDGELNSVRELVIEKEAELKRYQELADQRKREVDSLRGVLKEKQGLLEQIEAQQSEIESLTAFQTRLQEDYDIVQSMLEESQKELLILQQRQLDRDDTFRWEQVTKKRALYLFFNIAAT